MRRSLADATSRRGFIRRFSALTLALVAPIVIAGCASIAFGAPRVPSTAFDQPLSTPLGQLYWRNLGSASGQSGFYLLTSGPEAFAARGTLAAEAQRTLDLQYYIVEHDSTSAMLLDSVLSAAARGVHVRLLVDDLNVDGRDADLAALAGHANVQVRLFNPFAQRGRIGISQFLELLGAGDRLNHRMHNKLWIADDAVAIIGGRNLGDAYFSAAREDDFADIDVLAAGPVVNEMSHSFDAYWNSPLAVPIAAITGPPQPLPKLEDAWDRMAVRVRQFRDSAYIQALRKTAFGSLVRTAQIPLLHARAQVFYAAPTSPKGAVAEKPNAIFTALHQDVENARHEIMMVSPYFVPGDRAVALLCGLTGRGVQVRILTNSLASTDVPIVYAAYSRYRRRLLACGVKLYELIPEPHVKRTHAGLSSGASLHSKAVVIDGKTIFIGSMNLDPRSRDLNGEVALRIDSAELGRQMTTLFDESTELDQAYRVELDEPRNEKANLHWDAIVNGQPVRYTHAPLASLWRRLFIRIFGDLVPEGLL